MKFAKIFLSAALLLTMTACSDKNAAEVTNLPDVTTSESITAVSEETTSQAEETTTTAHTTTAALKATAAAETTATVSSAEALPTDEDGITTFSVSENTKYYECRISDENIVTDPEKFADKELLEKAKKLFEESELTENIMNDVQKNADEFGYTEGVDYSLECRFSCALASDLNGDGKTESAFIFSWIHDGSDAGSDVLTFANNSEIGGLVFSDSSGNLMLCPEGFAGDIEIRELKYNGFSHLIVTGGVSNMTSLTCIYSSDGSKLKCELSEGRISDFDEMILDNFVLKMSRPQNADWLVCWNNDIGSYTAIDAVYLDEEQSEEVILNVPVDDLNNYYAMFSGDPVVAVIGGRYYTLCEPLENESPLFTAFTYELIGGEYSRLTDREGYSYGIIVRPQIFTPDIPYLENFDFDTALNNIVSI